MWVIAFLMMSVVCRASPANARATNEASSAMATATGLKGLLRYRDLHRGDEALPGGGRGLTLGEGVDHIVVDDVGDVRVSPDGVHEVIAALPVHVAVPALGNHDKTSVRGFDRGCHRQGPAMEAVEVVRVQILGCFGLPDAQTNTTVPVELSLVQGVLDRRRMWKFPHPGTRRFMAWSKSYAPMHALLFPSFVQAFAYILGHEGETAVLRIAPSKAIPPCTG